MSERGGRAGERGGFFGVHLPDPASLPRRRRRDTEGFGEEPREPTTGNGGSQAQLCLGRLDTHRNGVFWRKSLAKPEFFHPFLLDGNCSRAGITGLLICKLKYSERLNFQTEVRRNTHTCTKSTSLSAFLPVGTGVTEVMLCSLPDCYFHVDTSLLLPFSSVCWFKIPGSF